MSFFQEKYAELRNAELSAKMDALQSAWGEFPDRLDAVAEAYDQVKVAEDEGSFGDDVTLDDSQRISLAVDMVQAVLAQEMDKEAEEAEMTEEVVEEVVEEEVAAEEVEETPEATLIEKEAEHHQLGVLLGRKLHDLGFVSEDLDKLASDEDSEQFGQLLAELTVEILED